MIIKSLKLVDFGAFRSEHIIDLEPREKYGKKRSIVLFGGLNGAGKTTILEAVRLALYGRQAIGKNVSQSDYDRYLLEAIHKSPHLLVNPDSASVSLEFVYSRLGKVFTYTVTRSWSASKSQIKESLELLCDGQSLSEISHDQTQSFLNELIPIGVSDLFFFDVRKSSHSLKKKGIGHLGNRFIASLALILSSVCEVTWQFITGVFRQSMVCQRFFCSLRSIGLIMTTIWQSLKKSKRTSLNLLVLLNIMKIS